MEHEELITTGPEEHKVINWQYNMKAAYDNTACAEVHLNYHI